MTIGSRIRQLRHENHFTLEFVAQFLKITPSALMKIEHNQKTLTISQLEKLCDLYCVDENYILKNKSEPSIKRYDFKRHDVNTTYRINRIIRNIELLSSLTD